jgi:serine protease Do
MNVKSVTVFLSGALAALGLLFLMAPAAVRAGLEGMDRPAVEGEALAAAPTSVAEDSRTASNAPAAKGGSAPSPATPPPVPASAGRRTTLVAATEKAAPAVVSIMVRSSAVVAVNPFYQDPFFDFFGPQYRRKESSSIGSGVIVSKDGYVITNSHVVGLSEEGRRAEVEAITVTLPDGRQFPAKPVGADPANDLAVIRIQGRDLPVADLQGEPDNLIGEWVVAIGNPYGYLIGDSKPTVTVGVLSATNRTFSSQSGIHYHNMIQTDAPINPGNSGGALVNGDGQVIGINTFILTGGGQSQGSIGLGFAIPIQKARLVMEELIKYGYIREFTTGIYTDPYLNQQREGVVVAGLDPKSPGEKAGLKVGDIIYKVAGKRISSFQDIQDVFKLFQVGESVEIHYLRGREQRSTRMVLEERVRKKRIF